MGDADEEEVAWGGLYEDGHWVWDDQTEALVFVSDLPPQHAEAVQITSKVPTGTVEFRDDIDLIEQLRYRRRYQRKMKPSGEQDYVTLQDVKDLVLYTAPLSILSPSLINMLHLPTTERFLRALIFCCAYYLQTADAMDKRIKEQETKIRTQDCELLEREFRINLNDLRLLVAKEYCIMLIGGADTKKFHHMGPFKKRRSLTDKDARFFETFIRVCVQIVYLALGRSSFTQIELECHRLLKSEIFNSIEHTHQTGYYNNLKPEVRKVLIGTCVQHGKKLNTRSPLINEIFCHRPIDYRLLGIGVIKYKRITTRLHFLYLVISGEEKKLFESNITVGIIGMNRSLFDTMLRRIVQAPSGKSKSSVMSSHSVHMSKNVMATSTSRKSTMGLQRYYPEIVIPPKEPFDDDLPSDFPIMSEPIKPVSDEQRRRWLNRLTRLTRVC